MGGILKRKNSKGKVTYMARIRRLGHPDKTATFGRRSHAEAWIHQEEIKVRQGTYLQDIEARKHTLTEAITRFIREEPDQKKRLTYLNRWNEQLGSFFLSAINAVAINDGVAYWKQAMKLSPSTMNRHLDALSVVMNKTKDWGWILHNPVYDVKRFREPKGRVRYLTPEEREGLLAACRESDYPYLYIIVVLALSTGMRKEELLSLRWSDLDIPKGVIILQKTKNKERRRVAVRGHAWELLKEHAKVRRLDTQFLFPGQKPSPQKECKAVCAVDRHFDIRKPWQTALKKAGIKDFVFHDLRHSCASYLAMNGASSLEIAEVLGHKSLDMVKRYAHLAESHTASIVERMNKSIFG